MNGVAGFPRKLDGQTGSDEDCPPE